MKNGTDEQKKAAANTLYRCLDTALKLLHPTMPYLTEELYQRLPAHPKKADSITIAEFPQKIEAYPESEELMKNIMMIIKGVRSQLGALNVPKNAKPHIMVRARTAEQVTLLKEEGILIETLVKAGKYEVLTETDAEPTGCVKTHLSEDFQSYINVVGLIDIKLELDRLTKR